MLNLRQRLILYSFFFYHSQLSLKVLADLTSCSERTIRRDIEFLENELNVPIDIESFTQVRHKYTTILNHVSTDSEMTVFEKAFLLLIEEKNLSASMHNTLVGNWDLTTNERNFVLMNALIKALDFFPQQLIFYTENCFLFFHPLVQQALQKMIVNLDLKAILVELNIRVEHILPKNRQYIQMYIELIFLAIVNNPKNNEDSSFLINSIGTNKKLPQTLFKTFVSNTFKRWINLDVDYESDAISSLYTHLSSESSNRLAPTQLVFPSFSSKLWNILLEESIILKDFVVVDKLALVYFWLYFEQHLSSIKWNFLVGCFGGAGTSVIVRSFIKNVFPKSLVEVNTIEHIRLMNSTEKYDVIILTHPFDVKRDYVYVPPNEILFDSYGTAKKIKLLLLEKLENF